MENDKIKFDIDNGPVFFADEVGVIHNPLKILLDFRSVTPRLDVRNKDYQPVVIRHSVMMMDPWTAKTLLDLLKQNIANYEKQFGKITKPQALKNVEKKAKKQKAPAKEESPTYLG